jgi:hypothetical protein
MTGVRSLKQSATQPRGGPQPWSRTRLVFAKSTSLIVTAAFRGWALLSTWLRLLRQGPVADQERGQLRPEPGRSPCLIVADATGDLRPQDAPIGTVLPAIQRRREGPTSKFSTMDVPRNARTARAGRSAAAHACSLHRSTLRQSPLAASAARAAVTGTAAIRPSVRRYCRPIPGRPGWSG